ncbi:putative serine incorporator [Stylophora pistillata]|uniref:Putative serine incorporator n=1 Tax=Stylophora pistillata TaxID=50429 RepID=A0A2B4S466_STYPI|nr:putative serine incorporator [Stylophora pistillata]
MDQLREQGESPIKQSIKSNDSAERHAEINTCSELEDGQMNSKGETYLPKTFHLLSVVGPGPKDKQLLQTSFVTMYTTYSTYASLRYGQSECDAERDYAIKTGNEPDLNLYSVADVLIIFCLLAFACLRAPQAYYRKLGRVHVMMIITNWYNPRETHYGEEALFLLVDFTRVWNKTWAQKMEKTGKRCWFHLVFVCTVVLYGISAAAVVCFYVFFGASHKCKTNKMFVSINLVLCAVAAVISIHPKVQDGGLLQSSVVTAYSVYLTWSALSYNPNERCNPVATYVSEADMRPNLNIQASLDLCLLVITIIYFSVRVSPITVTLRELIATTLRLIVGLRQRKVKDGEEQSPDGERGNEAPLHENKSPQHVFEFSDEKVPYSYSFFHFVYFVAAIHLTMVLTNWYSPEDGSNIKLSIAWAAMSIKMTSSSMCVLLYIWSLAVPILLYNKKPC